MDKETLEKFRKKCREHNLRLTPQRLAVYTELLASRDHPNAETVHRRLKSSFPGLSLDTVNRSLLAFARIDVAGVVEGTGSPKRFDGNTAQHHHFRCIDCGRLIDIYSDNYDRLRVPETIRRRFTVMRKRVCLEGLCDRCRKKKL